jgi:hypothetical protein
MTWMSDLLDAVGKVFKLEDRVTRLDASVEHLTDKVSDTRDRVIRLEGLIEGALRSRSAAPERQRLPER